MTDVVKFDPSKIADTLRDRIHLEILQIIPEEVWTKMLADEAKAFLEDQTESNSAYYGVGSTRRVPSKFRQIVHEVLERETRSRLHELFRSPAWTTWWNEKGQLVAGTELHQIVDVQGPKLIQSLLQGAIGTIVAQLASQFYPRP